MRTTLTLDKDVAAVIERLRKSRRQSLKAIVNDALREGLKQLDAPPRRRRPFRTATADLGRCSLPSLDSVVEVLAVAEGETFR
jgi:hypothetical protein